MKRHSLLGEEPRELNLEQQFQVELRDHEGDTVAGVSIIDRNPLMRWLQFMFAAGGAACELVDAIEGMLSESSSLHAPPQIGA